MSFYSGNAGREVFRDFSPGPHAGVDTDPDLHVVPDSIDSRARVALTLGAISLVLGVVTGVPAIWVGRKALTHISAADGALKGRWAAWTGIVLGFIGIAATIAVFIYLHQHPRSAHITPAPLSG